MFLHGIPGLSLYVQYLLKVGQSVKESNYSLLLKCGMVLTDGRSLLELLNIAAFQKRLGGESVGQNFCTVSSGWYKE